MIDTASLPSSPRLSFRFWTDGDLGLARELWGDLRVTALIDARGALDDHAVAARLDAEIALAERHGVQYWPVFERVTGAFVGCAGLRPREEAGCFEVGVHLVADRWGEGLATEAVGVVIAFAFGTLGAAWLFAGHNPKNDGSRRLLAKLGFRHTHDELYPPTGLMHPSYRLDRPEALREAPPPSDPGNRSPIASSHVLTILAADPVDRTAGFYESAFGWPRRVDLPHYVEFALPDGRGLGIYLRVALERLTGRTLATLASEAVSGAELYFHCTDLEAVLDRLGRLKAPLLSPLAGRDWGDEAAYFEDPEGNIIAAARPLSPMSDVSIRPIADADRHWIAARAEEVWGAEGVVSHGQMHYPARLAGFVAERDGSPAGLLTYRIDGEEAEIVTVDAFERFRGVGTALIAAAEAELRAAGCRRAWLVTTNDNLSALRFYQRRGYALEVVHPGALAESRKLKPAIPLVGEHGISMRDELVLTKTL